ncbi:MAG: GntR family transcriptional regulator [Bacillota bacterium]|nr:GntR family transcriptional regulator [Bacillota bacterium]
MNMTPPLYEQIYRELLCDIQSHRYDKQALPSERELCERYGVSRITARRAMSMLQERGYIERQRGRGSFVKQPSPGSPSCPAVRPTAIGFILPSFSYNYGSYLVTGVDEACRNADCTMLLRTSGHQLSTESQAIEQLLKSGADGLIIMPQHNNYFNPAVLRLVVDNFPLVIVDREMRGVQAPFVGTNNHEISRKATSLLLDLGHHEIAFMSSDIRTASTLKERFSGFKDAFFQRKRLWNEACLLNDLRSTVPGYDTEQQTSADRQRIQKFLQRNRNITAIFATEYALAQLILSTLHEMDLQVPRHISLLGFDGPAEVKGDSFLCRVVQAEADIGRQAVQVLRQRIMGLPCEQRTLLPAHVLRLPSVGPAPI